MGAFFTSGFPIFIFATISLFVGLFWHSKCFRVFMSSGSSAQTTFTRKEKRMDDKLDNFLYIFGLLATACVFLYVLLLYLQKLAVAGEVSGVAQIHSAFMQAVMLAVSFSYFLAIRGIKSKAFGAHTALSHKLPFETHALLLLSLFGAWMTLFSSNFLTLYVGLEIQTLCFYVLVGIRTESAKANEAAIKFFILGSVASAMLLFGIALFYGFTGSIAFDATTEGGSPWAACAAVFLLAGLAFKVSAVPFHMWTPDVYEGSPLPITVLLATASKLVGVGLLSKLLFGPLQHVFESWQSLLAFMGLISIVVGAFGALAQTHLKRLIAFSSIGHIGFILLALSVGSLVSILVYMVIYILTLVGLFRMIPFVLHEKKATFSLKHYAGIGKKHPWFGLAFSLLIFSLAGIPPLAGFFAKLDVFLALVEHGFTWMAVAAAALSVLGAAYYLWIVKTIYFDEASEDIVVEAPQHALGAVAPYLVFTIFYFFVPFLLDVFFAPAANLLP